MLFEATIFRGFFLFRHKYLLFIAKKVTIKAIFNENPDGMPG
jgi:hypothetical protein